MDRPWPRVGSQELLSPQRKLRQIPEKSAVWLPWPQLLPLHGHNKASMLERGVLCTLWDPAMWIHLSGPLIIREPGSCEELPCPVFKGAGNFLGTQGSRVQLGLGGRESER